MKQGRLKGLFGGEASSVLKGMATLAMGSVAARLIGIACIPLLTRIYSPEDYGVLSLYVAVVSILAPTLTLRYVQAIPLPRRHGMAMNLIALSFLLISAFAAATSVVLWLAGDIIFSWLSMEAIAPWWWLIILGATGAASYETLTLWCTRTKSYRAIARTQFTQSLAGESLKLILGLLAFKPFGLLLGNFASQSFGIASLLMQFKKDLSCLRQHVSRRRMMLVATYYSGFAKFRLPSQFLMVFSLQAPIMISSALYGAETTGQLGLALMALGLPVTLIGQSISQAYYAEIASIGKSNFYKIKKITETVQLRLLFAGVPISIAIYIFSEPAFTIAFGAEWSAAGTYASILSPYILTQLVSSPLTQVINLLNNQSYFLIINTLRVIGLGTIFILSRSLELSAGEFIGLLSGFLFALYALTAALIIRTVNSLASKQTNTIHHSGINGGYRGGVSK